MEGNLLSRINSSHRAGWDNVQVRSGWRRGRPVLDMFTWRDVQPGDQLLWYYGKSYFKNNPMPVKTLGFSPFASESARFDAARMFTKELECRGFAFDLCGLDTANCLAGPKGLMAAARRRARDQNVAWIMRKADAACLSLQRDIAKIFSPMKHMNNGDIIQHRDVLFVTYDDDNKVLPALRQLDILPCLETA